MIDIIIQIFIVSLFCLGVRTLLSSGMILHFLREPFETEDDSKLVNLLRRRLQKKSLNGEENLVEIRKKYERISEKTRYLMKPLFLCVVCFSSVWGLAALSLLNPLSEEFIPEIIVILVSSAFVIKFINDRIDF